MSTILDALKKSEQERKLNKVPTLSDMPAPQETRAWPTKLLIVIIVLLVMLIGVLLFQFLNKAHLEDQVTESGRLTATPNPIEEESNTDIVVNVVSYSEQEGQSFVMINGKLFRNGEFVRAGLRVEQIRPDQVVLNLRGRRIIKQP